MFPKMPKSTTKKELMLSPKSKANPSQKPSSIIENACRLELFFDQLRDIQVREISTLEDEIVFFRTTLEKLKSNVSALKVARHATIKEYISDRFSVLS
jgi:hypothetical protein